MSEPSSSYMLSCQAQDERAVEALTHANGDEGSRERWSIIEGFVRRMFELEGSRGEAGESGGGRMEDWYNPKTFVKFYTAVYEFCTVRRMGVGSSNPDGAHQQFQYGEQLYDLLSALLRSSFAAWSTRLTATTNLDDFVQGYLVCWAKFKEIVGPCETVFSYLERFWIDRRWDDYYTAKGGKDDGLRTLYIRPLMYQCWSRLVLEPSESRLLACLSALWTTNKDDSDDTIKAILSIIESYKMIGVPVKISSNRRLTVESGEKDFERKLLPWYRDCLARLCLDKIQHEDGIDGIGLESVEGLRRVWEEEVGRASTLLGSETLPFIRETLKQSLLIPALPRLTILFEECLKQQPDPVPSLSAIYQLISLRRSLVKSLCGGLEKGLIHRAACIEGSAIDGLLGLYRLSENLLSAAFNRNPDLAASRDAAFRQLFATISPTSFAHWADKSLRNEDASVVEYIPLLLQYVQDKATFQTAYQKHLATRLLTVVGISPLETRVITLLKESLGASYSQPLEKMVADVSQEDDTVRVLTAGVWPVEKADHLKEIIPPIAFTALCSSYEQKYRGKHPKRLLHWHPLLSTVQLDMILPSGRILPLKLNILQLTILQSLSHHPQDLASVSIKTGVPTSIISQVVASLEGIVDARTLAINPDPFVSVTDLTTPHHHHADDDASSSSSSPSPFQSALIPDATRLTHLIQAAIIRHMKASQTTKESDLITALSASLAQWATPTELDYEKAIQALIAREFVKRLPNNSLQYMP